MIIADATIWNAALRGQGHGLLALVTDLLNRGELVAPGIVFAELLAEAEDERVSNRLRGWAVEAVQLDEPVHAWIAAGDLGALLANHGVHISLTDRYLVSLCLREACPLWSRNPRFDEVARVVPLERYQPTGT